MTSSVKLQTCKLFLALGAEQAPDNPHLTSGKTGLTRLPIVGLCVCIYPTTLWPWLGWKPPSGRNQEESSINTTNQLIERDINDTSGYKTVCQTQMNK